MKLFCLLISVAVLISFLYEILIAANISVERTDYLYTHGITPSHYRPTTVWSRFIKRLTDIVTSLTVCVTVLPLLHIVLGILIKLNSKGPVLFKHRRVGRFGKEFTCYKFRSMYIDAGPQRAVENDSRVTPIGRFIRKTHLDEFPQFFNVLIGDMSLVGPRPLTKERLKQYDDRLLTNIRCLVLPGITGPNQLIGREHNLKIDIEYIQNQSWWQDIKLICQTLLLKDKSY